MLNPDLKHIIYSSTTLEFVTVGVEFCSFLEKMEPTSKDEWIKKALRILPLLYIKATLLPDIEPLDSHSIETFVKEQDYTIVSKHVESMLGEDDVYLDVFIEDMKYSDRPISSFISEDIADIYQDIRNFISIYQYNIEESMAGALYRCVENFHSYWGQKLVNVLRPLHNLAYHHFDQDLKQDSGEEERNIWL